MTVASRAGSWPVLVLCVAGFLLAFQGQRQRSSFLSIEADREAALAVAERHGLTLAEAFALRDLAAATAEDPAAASSWHAAAASFAAERSTLGDALAAVAAAGSAELARTAVRDAGDPERAWLQFRRHSAALPGLRFLALRERFASRLEARD
jgi:hypothetical protein